MGSHYRVTFIQKMCYCHFYGKQFYCKIAINKETRCANNLLKNPHALGKTKVSAVCQPENQLPIAKTTFLYEKFLKVVWVNCCNY